MARSMPDQPEFKSIADVLAAAEQKRSAATTKPVTKKRFTAAAPAASPNDIRDDFDYAIEFVETARKGGGIGYVLGLLFLALGVGRLYLLSRRK